MIKLFSILLALSFPLYALCEDTTQAAPEEAKVKKEAGENREPAGETTNKVSEATVALSNEQKNYDKCVTDSLMDVFQDTYNCTFSIPADTNEQVKINHMDMCFYQKANDVKNIISKCEPLLTPATENETIEKITDEAGEEIIELSNEQKQYGRCVSNLVIIVLRGTRTCIVSAPVDADEQQATHYIDICHHRGAKATKNIIPSCEPLLKQKTETDG